MPITGTSETHHSFCRNCPAACGLLIDVTDGRLSVRGDRDHPVSKGYLCVKGRTSADWHNGEDRLTRSLLRDDGGALAAVGTGRALDELAARIEGVVARHGPRSVALYYGTGAKMNTLGAMALRAWLKELDSPYLYSSSTVDQSAKWVTAGRLGMFATGRYPVDEADVIMAVGSNPLVSHCPPVMTSNPDRWTRAAKARGAKIIVLDPRRTEFARHADLHLALRPGEDAPVLAAMIRTILAEGWEDARFCDRFVQSLDRLREAVQPFTPEVAAARADVPAADIVEAARLFATARRRTAVSGTGADMALRSNLNEHLLEALNAICGAYRRAGDVVRNPGSFNRQTGISEKVVPPRRSWEEEPKLWTEDSGMVGGEFPASRLPNEILHGGIRALLVVGGNPALALGQPAKTLAALRKLDILGVIDSRLTATAQLAHVVIPSRLPYERWDATNFVDGFFPEPFAQIAAPVSEAPPDMLDDWEIFWELSKRAGRTQSLSEYKWGGGTGRQLRLDMDRRPASEDLIRWLCEAANLSCADMLANPGGLRTGYPPLTIGPAGADDGARLDVCPPDVAEELVRVVGERDHLHAYRLTVRRMLETMNSAFRDAKATRRRFPVNYAFMNPADMEREGLRDGDSIEIASDAGRIVGTARADKTLRSGVISMSHQWGNPDGGPGETGAFTGELVSLDRDLETINYMPRQTGIPISIRPAGE